MLCAGLGQHERAIGEIEGGQLIFAGELCPDAAPVQAAGDHQVQDEPEIAVESEGDALSDAAQLSHGATFGIAQRRNRRAQ